VRSDTRSETYTATYSNSHNPGGCVNLDLRCVATGGSANGAAIGASDGVVADIAIDIFVDITINIFVGGLRVNDNGLFPFVKR
jgi:hypothetical protein